MNGLRRVHRGSAIVLALYALVHLANHLAALDGVASHIAFMDAVRGLTRVPAVEALLLACVLVQVGTGLAFLLRRRGGPMPPFLRMQAVSGAYLAFFLLVHVSSVLAGRFVFKLDTNFHYAAAGLHLAPFHFFFVPYYGLAVLALFVHLAGALHLLVRGRVVAATRVRMGQAGAVLGLVVAGLILAAFGGLLYPVVIPDAYLDNLRGFLP
ncbi:hypothetical protein G4G28_16800 [Massilia sp. Dwa41.01b]|uniref:hypothetical protein n=1 Tax=Massilia sp. Dwa41.01b TaxID=2709302 RepID=UPI0015FF3CB8|nr:hypothetical protein [Massilia sp. Dwa41.01b]QNA89719.1 hypothetical protein G4G28_16800 [Massilia sp. Dwa41.01b]